MNDVIALIKNHQASFSTAELKLANYLIDNPHLKDISPSIIVKKLAISNSTLTRFAKKNGFNGYNEFSYAFKKSQFTNPQFEKTTGSDAILSHSYQELVQANFQRIKIADINFLIKKMENSKRIFLFGIGNSDYAAKDFKLRFLRLGYQVDAIDDSHMMNFLIKTNLTKDDLIILFSLSSTTPEIRATIKHVNKKFPIILVTAHDLPINQKQVMRTIIIAENMNLTLGQNISPQIPFLIFSDLLYTTITKDNKVRLAKMKKSLSK